MCWYKNEKKENNELINTLLNVELSEEDLKKLEIPPLIEMKVKLEQALEVKGLYDPGSRITVINARLLNNELIKNKKNYHLKTISGWGKNSKMQKKKKMMKQ